jgi:hypothetical protein
VNVRYCNPPTMLLKGVRLDNGMPSSLRNRDRETKGVEHGLQVDVLNF